MAQLEIWAGHLDAWIAIGYVEIYISKCGHPLFGKFVAQKCYSDY